MKLGHGRGMRSVQRDKVRFELFQTLFPPVYQPSHGGDPGQVAFVRGSQPAFDYSVIFKDCSAKKKDLEHLRDIREDLCFMVPQDLVEVQILDLIARKPWQSVEDQMPLPIRQPPQASDLLKNSMSRGLGQGHFWATWYKHLAFIKGTLVDLHEVGNPPAISLSQGGPWVKAIAW